MKSLREYEKPLLVCFFVIGLACTTMARPEQQGSQPSPAATPPASAPSGPPVAAPADVSSIDAIIKAVYEAHSGAKGQKRDWDRMRSLFVPGARLILPMRAEKPGGYSWRLAAVEEYVTRVFPLLEQDGFFEKEVGRRIETWANIAQVFSAYESRRNIDDPKPFMRGINSFQLVNDGSRWWIVTVLWQNEDEKNPLPESILKQVR